ncbi:MAG: polymer-forming cytoskeletal protein [Acidobacteriota bacterium]|nr:polymer-forming cytoskeletal protein [Acidobacteriota bacterium]
MDSVLVSHIWRPRALRRVVANASAAVMLLVVAVIAAYGAQEAGVVSAVRENEQPPLVVEGESASDVFGLGRSVVVRGSVRHGVVSFGGDVIVEGRVEGDVAAVGGSVRQSPGSFIGGDVIVIGGAYHHGKSAPGRDPRSKTLMYAGYEEELREMARHPSSLLTPRLSPVYVGQRVLSVLFWFILSLALTAMSPGAISRAVARLQLTNLRVAVIGVVGAFVLTFGSTISLKLLPPALGATVGMMALLCLLVSYVFGRVVIHAATGRWLQRQLLSEERRSESVALLLGAGFWAVMLTLPYVWPLLVAGLVVASLGLSLTARYRIGWKRA